MSKHARHAASTARPVDGTPCDIDAPALQACCARVTSSLAPAIGMLAAAAHSRSGRRETAARSSAPRFARRAAAASPRPSRRTRESNSGSTRESSSWCCRSSSALLSPSPSRSASPGLANTRERRLERTGLYSPAYSTTPPKPPSLCERPLAGAGAGARARVGVGAGEGAGVVTSVGALASSGDGCSSRVLLAAAAAARGLTTVAWSACAWAFLRGPGVGSPRGRPAPSRHAPPAAGAPEQGAWVIFRVPVLLAGAGAAAFAGAGAGAGAGYLFAGTPAQRGRKMTRRAEAPSLQRRGRRAAWAHRTSRCQGELPCASGTDGAQEAVARAACRHSTAAARGVHLNTIRNGCAKPNQDGHRLGAPTVCSNMQRSDAVPASVDCHLASFYERDDGVGFV
eukprot:scaffold44653_cov61-Phaeocystis_antarctica.AAC.3